VQPPITLGAAPSWYRRRLGPERVDTVLEAALAAPVSIELGGGPHRVAIIVDHTACQHGCPDDRR